MTSYNGNPGITKNRHRLGVVITESTTYSTAAMLTDIEFAELKRTLNANSPQGRFDRLQSRVAKHLLPQFVGELAYIERKLTSQNFTLSGPDDPIEHAMRALDRGLLIEATEVHFANIIAAMRAKEQRIKAARKSRNRAVGANRDCPATLPNVTAFATDFVRRRGSHYGLIAAVARHFKVTRTTAKTLINKANLPDGLGI